MLQIEKVIPAGVNRLGYRADTSPVFRPLIGKILASAFTAIMHKNARVLSMVFFIFSSLGKGRRYLIVMII